MKQQTPLSRTELLEEIKNLPKFELVTPYVKRDGEYVDQQQKAVVEVDNVVAYAYVSPRYNLVDFEEIFKPIVENIQECEGYVQTIGGFARLVLFPKIGEFQDGNEKWGIIAMNSVDKTSAIIVRFCLTKNGRTITLPKGMAGYSKPHSSKAAVNVKDFINVLTKVKDQWKNIIDKFAEYHVTQDNIGDILENTGIYDKKLVKDTKEIVKSGVTYVLWDFFMDMIDHISDKKYKSNVHKERKMDRVCEAIINYCILLRI